MKSKTLRTDLSILLLFCFFTGIIYGPGKIGLLPHNKHKQNPHHTYYVDAVLGNDINDGRSISRPWKSLNGVNEFAFTPGDEILFKRGQTFNGQLKIDNSGTKTDYITYSSYGSGEKPVISGLITLSQWKNLGNGIWEADCQACSINLKVVLMNNQEMAIGRYPNIAAPNGGYLKYKSHLNKNTIVDNEVNNNTDWTGAEVVVRKTQWVLDRGIITAHSAHNLTYKTASKWDFNDGFGYFIQNDPRTLDQLGEWYYNADTKKIQLFFGTASPNKYIIKVSNIDNLATVNGSFITIKDISFVGSNVTAIKINKVDHVNIKGNEIAFSGKNGIYSYATNLVVENNKIDHTYNIAIEGYNGLNTVIKGNAILNTGLIPGMGTVYSAVDITGNNMLIYLNHIDKCGYNGIRLDGNNCIVKNNVISNFTMTLDDGGGIYMDDPQYKGRQVIDNIIINGVGAPNGTAWLGEKTTEGIYADDSTSNISILGNTVANIAGHGIKIHNAHAITIKNNTLFNNPVQLILDHDRNPAGGSIHDIIVRDNIMVSKTDKQNNLVLASTVDDIGNYGLIDSNYYVQPIGSDNNLNIATKIVNSPGKNYDLIQWKKAFSFDQNSQMVTFQDNKEDAVNSGTNTANLQNQILFDYNTTTAPKKVSLGKATYFDAKNKIYIGNATIVPYSSILLFKKN